MVDIVFGIAMKSPGRRSLPPPGMLTAGEASRGNATRLAQIALSDTFLTIDRVAGRNFARDGPSYSESRRRI